MTIDFIESLEVIATTCSASDCTWRGSTGYFDSGFFSLEYKFGSFRYTSNTKTGLYVAFHIAFPVLEMPAGFLFMMLL